MVEKAWRHQIRVVEVQVRVEGTSEGDRHVEKGETTLPATAGRDVPVLRVDEGEMTPLAMEGRNVPVHLVDGGEMTLPAMGVKDVPVHHGDAEEMTPPVMEEEGVPVHRGDEEEMTPPVMEEEDVPAHRGDEEEMTPPVMAEKDVPVLRVATKGGARERAVAQDFGTGVEAILKRAPLGERAIRPSSWLPPVPWAWSWLLVVSWRPLAWDR